MKIPSPLLGLALAILATAAPPQSYERSLTSPNPKLLESCVVAALGGDNSRVIGTDSPLYTDARLGEKIQFDELPALISYAKTAAEVQALVRCAQKTGYRAVPRSGGHHFEAYSALTGTLVIDVAHINYVNVSYDQESAQVGAGIRLGALYTELWKHDGKTFVGGICPTVGLGGLISAAGFNMQMRNLGFSIDYVLSAKVVLASGELVTASPEENEDLFWAIRGGGGGTYGIVVEFDLKILTMPRSAMVKIDWPIENRFAVAKRFFEWAPKAPREFTSQVNVRNNSVEVIGWYYGKTKADAEKLIASSGLLSIGNATATIAGNCNTVNSRMFGYTIFDCVPDNEVDASAMNVLTEPFAQYLNYSQFKLDPIPKNPDIPAAYPWHRFKRIAKTFIVTKDRIIDDATLQGVIDRISALPGESLVWGEWHAWNVSATGTDSAFPWRDEAYAVMEFQITGSDNEAETKSYYDWMQELEGYLRPKLG